ncbi:hybrid sensor histidine kinase/response regulator [Oscillatoria acuminata]|uniref:histidine kinase n=1 Tax=Oscillatoria acuminata PCC 6304 TaxID=56110 RepID=K9TF11_9CYAN|nr:response regulator [Oscillatoria acuminata]AFY80998.1 histidine kinase,Response regulator receiver domain protein,histidine kinase [Oscillatoria acuminata PCC 6304]
MDSNQSSNYLAKILVVDDTPDNLRVLSAILSEQGYQVGKALNGQVALMASKQLKPDLILLDINMPQMNGYEVCKHLKSNSETGDIPIIFISALDDVLDKVKAFEMGGLDYITKPFQSAEVISRVKNQLNLRFLQLKLKEQNIALETEIQEHKKAKTALEFSEAQNLALLNAIPDLMLRLSAEGTLLDYRISLSLLHETPRTETPESTGSTSSVSARLNRDFHQFAIREAGTLERDWMGKNLAEIWTEDLAFWMMHYVQEVLLTSDIKIGEFVQQIEGKWQGYEARFVKSGSNEVLAIVRDISERKQAEVLQLQNEALLRSQKQQLEQALQDLKQAQSQLVQNEKMVSLGHLVAGIAHEINNPVNFIYGNIPCILQYIEEILEVLHLYENNCQKNPAIQQLTEKIDLPFVKNDLHQILDSMQNGTERIRELVISLRNFSRLDEADMKPVDIHEGIDSTLLLLKHRMEPEEHLPGIEVIKNYGNLPEVTCYASQINQVLMHLLNNAIDALKEVGIQWQQTHPSLPTSPAPMLQIQITTELTDNQAIAIRIADNGPGIPEALQSQLFDPFFTTKPVGSGTGLGLSISYQVVVNQHKGQLMCYSSPGKGSEFVVRIPIH